jgi:hypothetical protein
MDMIDGIIVGAAAAAIGTIVAFKFINAKTVGGQQPNQTAVSGNWEAGRPKALYVIDTDPTTGVASPLAQNNPITEAAYNVQPVAFEAGFGPGVNQANDSAVMPQ